MSAPQYTNADTNKNTALTVYLDAVGLFAPSMPNWQAAQAILGANQASMNHAELEALPVPAPTVLPPAERRRVGTGVKLALAAGLDALQGKIETGATFQTVFTSSGGDGDNCHALCEALAEPDRAISPTRFTNSVHNAPSGYWGIALRAKPASTSICAFDGSFGAGFLDAVTQVQALQTGVLLVSYDTPYPPPLSSVRPITGHVAVALLLSPKRSASSMAQLRIELSTDAPPSTLANERLEALRRNNPTARALPLLCQFSQSKNGLVVLDYLPNCHIGIECSVYGK